MATRNRKKRKRSNAKRPAPSTLIPSTTKTPPLAIGSKTKVRRHVLWSASFIFPTLALIFLTVYLLQSPKENFVANLATNSDIKITYVGTYLDKKSPTCGCMFASSDEWRGISFLSKQVQLGPTIGATSTTSAYQISASVPSTVKAYSNFFVLSARHLSLAIPHGEPFEAIGVANDLADSLGYKVLADEQIPFAPTMTIFTNGPLYEESLGPAPIGTWIPSSDGHLDVSRRKDDAAYTIREDFDHLPDPKNPAMLKHYKTDGDVFSIVDLLGPKLIVWTTTPAIMFGGKGFKTSGTSLPGTDEIEAIILDVPFALRTTLGGYEGMDLEKIKIQDYDRDGMDVDPIAKGSVSVQLSNPENTLVSHQHVENYLSHNVFVDGCGYSPYGVVNGVQKTCVNFREPLLPKRDSLNVFGQVSKISFSAVSGSMMIGARQFPIDPSVPIDLLEVNSFDNPLGDTTIPIQIGSDKIDLNTRFAAKGRVTVNGEPLIRRIDLWAQFSGAVALVLSLGSVCAWVLTFVSSKTTGKT